MYKCCNNAVYRTGVHVPIPYLGGKRLFGVFSSGGGGLHDNNKEVVGITNATITQRQKLQKTNI